MGEVGLPELLLILAIALLIFGPRKIGELGKGLGEAIRGFRSGLSGEAKKSESKEEAKQEPTETKQS